MKPKINWVWEIIWSRFSRNRFAQVSKGLMNVLVSDSLLLMLWCPVVIMFDYQGIYMTGTWHLTWMQSFTAYRYASNISWIYIFGRLYCTCIYTYNIVSQYNRYTENAQVGSLPSILTCLGSIFGVIVILSGVRFSSINREFPLNTSSTEATNSGGSRISQIGGKNLLHYLARFLPKTAWK